MKLYFYNTRANFGDELNTWLWERLLPGCWDPGDGIYFSGIGTIINARMPPAKKWIVFTSGVGYGHLPPDLGDPARWAIISVRGPLTAKALGLPADLAITDGALLLRSLSDYAPVPERDRRGVVFMPHHSIDGDLDWNKLCRAADVEYLSPRGESRAVVERLRYAKLVLADAMHAAIIADALRVPWVPMVTTADINTFKWLDWTRSMAVPYEPVRLPSPTITLGVRNAISWMTGERYSFTPRGDDNALRHFERQNRLRQDASPRSFGRRMNRRAERILGRREIEPLLSVASRRRFDSAARSLAKAALRSGILSDERIHIDRLDALSARLRMIKSLAL